MYFASPVKVQMTFALEFAHLMKKKNNTHCIHMWCFLFRVIRMGWVGLRSLKSDVVTILKVFRYIWDSRSQGGGW